ncbi:MAG: hypothetical protein OXH47_10085 [Paracoccaceae bacterium]|nr:hypothetical protein [Paracoccaceae bacterium]
MSEQDGLVDLARQVAVLEERMSTITESYDRGWKLIEAKLGEDIARLETRMGEDNAHRDVEFAKLRENSAKRDRNMSIQIYAVAFGIIIVIIGGTIISLLV